MEIDVRSIFIE